MGNQCTTACCGTTENEIRTNGEIQTGKEEQHAVTGMPGANQRQQEYTRESEIEAAGMSSIDTGRNDVSGEALNL